MKIDTSTIKGFDKMTPEEQLKAVLDAELPDQPDMSQYVKKDAMSKANSEAAEWKRKFNDTLSDAEKKDAEVKEQYAAMQKELDDLKKEKAGASFKADLISNGYDDALADEQVKTLLSAGVTDEKAMKKFFANEQQFKANLMKDLEANAMKSTPKPTTGNGKEPMTLEAFHKLSANERHDFSVSNPDEYKAMYETPAAK